MAGRSATQVIDFSSPVRSQHRLARFVWLAVFGALFVIGLFVIATSAYEASVPHRSPISVELREGEFLVRRNDTPEPIREWDRLIVLGGVVLDGTASQLDEVVDDLPPQIEYEAVFERGSRERIRAVLTLENGTVFTPVIAALLTLLAPFGWLAVASRGNDARGRREFLFLAAATSALLLPMVPTSWREIGRPFNGLEYGSGSDWAYFYFLALWPVLYGLFLGRFLITVAGDPQGRERWLFGWRLILLTTVASLLGFATTYPFLEMAGFSLFVGLLLVLLLASSLLRGRSPLALAVTICLPFLGVATLILIRDVQVGVSLRTMIAEIEIIIGIVLVTGAGISAVLALIYWPLTILRLARSGQQLGGIAARQIEVAMSGIRLGAIAFLGWMVVFLGGAILLMMHFYGRANEMGASWVLPVYASAVIALFIVAVALPFVGVFLAVTRRGLWNADLLFRRVLFGSSLGAVLFLFWEVTSLSLSSFTSGVTNPLTASLVSAFALALVRPQVEKGVDRLVFPRGGELAESIQHLRLKAHSAVESLTGEDLSAIRADGAAIITLTSPVSAHARRIGITDRQIAAAAVSVADAPSQHEHFVIFEDDRVWFAFRTRLNDGSTGIVLLEPARGARLYDETERRELLFLFQLIQSRLFWPL